MARRPHSSRPAPAKAGDKVQIKDFLYDPEAISVAVGTKITFTNEDGAPHTATSGPSPTADGVFETGTLKKGQSKSVTVTKAGTFAYYCAIHPFMKGHGDRQMSLAPANALRYLGALATLVVGAVHLQQYADFISDVPTIGVLFLLNGLGAGVVAILLATRRAPLGALGGIAVSAGALVSVLISMTDGGLFDYTEPTFRSAVVIAIAAEVVARRPAARIPRHPAPGDPQAGGLDRTPTRRRLIRTPPPAAVAARSPNELPELHSARRQRAQRRGCRPKTNHLFDTIDRRTARDGENASRVRRDDGGGARPMGARGYASIDASAAGTTNAENSVENVATVAATAEVLARSSTGGAEQPAGKIDAVASLRTSARRRRRRRTTTSW